MQEQFYPANFGISKQELITLKSATLASPSMKLRAIRTLEQLRSCLDCIAAMALAPSREEVCARKGGHVIRSAGRTKQMACHECGKEVIGTAELRHQEEAQLQYHRNIQYWVADVANTHYVR